MVELPVLDTAELGLAGPKRPDRLDGTPRVGTGGVEFEDPKRPVELEVGLADEAGASELGLPNRAAMSMGRVICSSNNLEVWLADEDGATKLGLPNRAAMSIGLVICSPNDLEVWLPAPLT